MKILEKQMLSENINQIKDFVDINDSCITKVYENIQKEQAANNNDESSTNDDNVQEADYEEE